MRILRWRAMTWGLVIWSVVMGSWMVGGGSTGNNAAAACTDDPSVVSGVLSKQACIDASHVGTGVGLTLIFLLWFLGFIVLSLVWFMTRPRRRSCPACGDDVKKGLTSCTGCGFDFAAVAQAGNAVPAPPV